MNEDRGLIPETLGDKSTFEKSPFIQGFLAGIRGVIVGAPVGAIAQAARGRNPLVGAIVGGLGAGVATGLARGVAQKLENIESEENFRYHLNQIKSREPFVFMPPPELFRRALRSREEAPHAH